MAKAMSLKSARIVRRVFNMPLTNGAANVFGTMAKMFNVRYQTGKTREIAAQIIRTKMQENRGSWLSYIFRIPKHEALALAKMETPSGNFTRDIEIGTYERYIGLWEAGDCPSGRLQPMEPDDPTNWRTETKVAEIPDPHVLSRMGKNIFDELPEARAKYGKYLNVTLSDDLFEEFYREVIEPETRYGRHGYPFYKFYEKDRIIAQLKQGPEPITG